MEYHLWNAKESKFYSRVEKIWEEFIQERRPA